MVEDMEVDKQIAVLNLQALPEEKSTFFLEFADNLEDSLVVDKVVGTQKENYYQ